MGVNSGIPFLSRSLSGSGSKGVSVLEGLLFWGRRELVLVDLSGRVHVRQSTGSKSESVVWSEEGSQEGLTLRLVDLAGSVVVVLSPEVVEVGGHVSINLVVVHDVESSHDVGSPLGSGPLRELPHTGACAGGVSLLDSIALEDVVHDVVLVGTVALAGKVVSVGGVGAWGGRGESDSTCDLDGLRLLRGEESSQE